MGFLIMSGWELSNIGISWVLNIFMSGWELRKNRISMDFLYFLMSGWDLSNIGISWDSYY